MHRKPFRPDSSSLFAEGKVLLQEQSNRRWELSLRGEPRAENQKAKLGFFSPLPLCSLKLSLLSCPCPMSHGSGLVSAGQRGIPGA